MILQIIYVYFALKKKTKCKIYVDYHVVKGHEFDW